MKQWWPNLLKNNNIQFGRQGYWTLIIDCINTYIAKTRATLSAEKPRLPRPVYVQRVQIVKQWGAWSGLGSHGFYVFCLVASVFTLVVKLGIMKFWLVKLNMILKVKVNRPQNNRDINQGICTYPNLVILVWTGDKLYRGLAQMG